MARRAELHFSRGQFARSGKARRSARQAERDNLLARLVLAEVYAETGRTEEANESYRWFIRYYNEPPSQRMRQACSSSPQGAIQYARWNHNTQIFHFVVNTLCPDALKNDPNAWESHLLSGGLLLEKFNREQAVPELEQALAINPRAAGRSCFWAKTRIDQNDFRESCSRKRTKHWASIRRFPEAL